MMQLCHYIATTLQSKLYDTHNLTNNLSFVKYIRHHEAIKNIVQS